MPAVSIVVPTFRRPTFLREALRSAVAQTYTDIEILVCDNGADRATEQVVAEFADRRIRYLPRPTDLGMLRNAVQGFQEARGDLVMKLDDDDLLEPTAVAALLAPMRAHPEVTVAFGRFTLIDASGHPLVRESAAHEAASGRDTLTAGCHRPADILVTRGTVGLVCALVRRDAVDWHAVPDGVATAYDRHIALQAARDGAPMWFVPEQLAAYRLHAHSDSARALLRQLLGSLYATDLAIDSGRFVDLDALHAEAAATAARAGRLLLHEARVREARTLLWRALRRHHDPAVARLAALSCLPGAIARPLTLARHEAYLRALTPGASPTPMGANARAGQDVERTE